jgi:hypothetical protein
MTLEDEGGEGGIVYATITNYTQRYSKFRSTRNNYPQESREIKYL